MADEILHTGYDRGQLQAEIYFRITGGKIAL